MLFVTEKSKTNKQKETIELKHFVDCVNIDAICLLALQIVHRSVFVKVLLCT